MKRCAWDRDRVCDDECAARYRGKVKNDGVEVEETGCARGRFKIVEE